MNFLLRISETLGDLLLKYENIKKDSLEFASAMLTLCLEMVKEDFYSDADCFYDVNQALLKVLLDSWKDGQRFICTS